MSKVASYSISNFHLAQLHINTNNYTLTIVDIHIVSISTIKQNISYIK